MLPSSFAAALTSSFHPVVGNNKLGESISRRVGGHWIAVSTTSNNRNNSSTDDDVIGRVNIRAFSSSSSPLLFAAPSLPSSSLPINAESRSAADDAAGKRQQPYADGPPESLTIETILAIQGVMKFYILHGIGKYKLEQIAAAATAATTADSSLVERWQRMIAIYLETQCRAISLMGYSPDEYGITRYTQQVQRVMSVSSPSEQEEVRLAGRDTYRLVLSSAFATTVPNLMNEHANMKKGGGGGELSIVDARNIMHKVSLRMLETEILEKVSKRCAASASAHGGDGNTSSLTDEENNLQLEFARKHTIVQEVMVTDVYLSSSDGGGDATTTTTTTTTSRPSLVEECGFGTGEAGYVRLQYALNMWERQLCNYCRQRGLIWRQCRNRHRRCSRKQQQQQ
jgi:hypothetical protein